MKLPPQAIVSLTCLYWVAVLMLAFLAGGAPCGLAPGMDCELQPPALFWRVLGEIGPLGVLLPALAVYLGVVWLNGRGKKVL